MIKDGKLTFEDLDGPVEVEDPSRIKVKIARQRREALMEASIGKTTILRDEVHIAKDGKNEASGSLTIKGSKA